MDPGRNGIRNIGDEDDINDLILAEDDIIETVDLEPNEQEGEMAVDMDMLDVDDGDEADDEEDGDEAMFTTPERDDAKLVFTKHTGSVFCVAVDPVHSQLVVTGGEDDKAYVWNISTGEVLLECTGHKDSVTCVAISPDSVYAATGDLAGMIQVWDLQQLKLIWSFEVSDLEWLSWHTVAPVLLAGTVDGDMWMWKLPGGDTKTFQSFGPASNIGCVLPDGKRCVSGYADGSVRVWDLKATTPLYTFSGYTGQKSSITSISCHADNGAVITGSTDCTANLYNTTSGKVVARFQCNSEAGGGENTEENSVESVAISNVFPFAATGTLSGHLSIWDVPSQICRQQCKHSSGIVKLCWHETQPLIYTCTLDGAVHMWDARTGSMERQWLGHEASILDMQVSKDGSTIVTTSDDHTARVFTL